MKETKNWLKIAEEKTRQQITAARFGIRTIDMFRIFDKSSDLLEERRRLSAEIKEAKRFWREERYKAVLRGDLPKEKYRPAPKRPEIVNVIPLDTTKSDAEKRNLLLVS